MVFPTADPRSLDPLKGFKHRPYIFIKHLSAIAVEVCVTAEMTKGAAIQAPTRIYCAAN